MQKHTSWNYLTFCKHIASITLLLLLMTMTGCQPQVLTGQTAPAANSAAITAGSENLVMLSGSNSSQTDLLEIHFLDVGQGLSVFAASGGQTMLYDGGDRDYSSFVVSYLKEQGADHLNYIIASHYDADHINGLVGAMKAFSVDTIIGPDYIHSSRVYESFTRQAQALGKEIDHPAVGTEYYLGNSKITILSPKNIVKRSNNNSVAIKIENGEHTVIIMGDAEHEEEADILLSGINLDCTVLVPGHHGSASSTTWDLLEKTIPEYAVISCGQNNSYGHPHEETMEKLETMEIDIFRTDTQGTIVLLSNGQDLTWNTTPSADYSSGSRDDTKKSVQAPAPTEGSTEASGKISHLVWKSATGTKYHSIPDCGSMNPDKSSQITLDYAESIGLGQCQNCWQ